MSGLLAHAFYCDWRCDLAVNGDQLRRALDLEDQVGRLGASQLEPASEVAGLYLLATGQLDEAREIPTTTLARAEAEGLEYVRSDVLLRLSLIATRTGDPGRGAELATAGADIAEQLGLSQLISALLYGLGFAALHLGNRPAAEQACGRGGDLSRAIGDRVYLRAHQAVLGALALAEGDHAAAAAQLSPLIAGLDELGRWLESYWAPEIVEGPDRLWPDRAGRGAAAPGQGQP